MPKPIDVTKPVEVILANSSENKVPARILCSDFSGSIILVGVNFYRPGAHRENETLLYFNKDGSQVEGKYSCYVLQNVPEIKKMYQYIYCLQDDLDYSSWGDRLVADLAAPSHPTYAGYLEATFEDGELLDIKFIRKDSK